MEILSSDPVKKMKPFTFAGISYAPASGLPWVGTMVALRGIQIKEKRGLTGARYRMDQNLMLIPSINTNIEAKALVVHESVHAWQDFSRLGLKPASDTEGPAHIIQMMYLIPQAPPTDRLRASRPDVDKIYEISWSIAEKILQGQTPDGKEYEALRTTIATVHEYQKSEQYDGVYVPVYFSPVI